MTENGQGVIDSYVNKGFTGQQMVINGQGANGSNSFVIEDGKRTKWTCIGLAKRRIAVAAVIPVILFVPFIGALVYIKLSLGEPSHRQEPTVLGNYSTAAIATDAEPCAKIGM